MTSVRVWQKVFEPRGPATAEDSRDAVYTIANAVTLFRAALAVTLIGTAIVAQSRSLLLWGLGTSMVFDLADGYIARFTHSISILGAQLDRLADSLAALLVCAAAISMDRDVLTVVAAATVWVEFGVIDQLLASQFLRFGLWSPDHFYYVDERTWRMNWSAPAKLAGSLPILLLATGSSLAWAAFALALLLAIGKIQSMNQITKVAQHLPSARVPEPDWTDPQRERRMSCARGG